MSQENFSDTSPDTLSKVTARFAAWRNDSKRTKKIPEELWQAAVGLSNEYSINQISKTLRLNYADLKKRAIRNSFFYLNPSESHSTMYILSRVLYETLTFEC